MSPRGTSVCVQWLLLSVEPGEVFECLRYTFGGVGSKDERKIHDFFLGSIEKNLQNQDIYSLYYGGMELVHLSGRCGHTSATVLLGQRIQGGPQLPVTSLLVDVL